MLAIGAHAEPRGPCEILLATARCAVRAGVVHADIEQVHTGAIFVIEPADVGTRTVSLDHHGNAVELVTRGVKDVSHYTGAPQNLSNAAVRFAAISFGERPSI